MLNINSDAFFVVGAPKCGTTTLYSWLSKHPNILMSSIKEPHFFNNDLSYGNIKSFAEYRKMFSDFRPDVHDVIGEASALYLYSENAVANIEKTFDRPKYIILTRSRPEMFKSYHNQMLFASQESIRDSAIAWALSHKRRNNQKLPFMCDESKLLDYKRICMLGEQVDGVLDIVDEKRVHITSLKKIKMNPKVVHKRILKFLCVDPITFDKYKKKNSASKSRSKTIRFILRKIGQASKSAKRFFKIPPNVNSGLLDIIKQMNTKTGYESSLDSELTKEINDFYQEDSELLSYHTKNIDET